MNYELLNFLIVELQDCWNSSSRECVDKLLSLVGFFFMSRSVYSPGFQLSLLLGFWIVGPLGSKIELSPLIVGLISSVSMQDFEVVDKQTYK